MSWRWAIQVIMELRDASVEWLDGKADNTRITQAVAQFVHMQANEEQELAAKEKARHG